MKLRHHLSPPIPRNEEEPSKMPTLSYSTAKLEMPAPERSDGTKRVKVTAEHPSQDNENTNNRPCRE